MKLSEILWADIIAELAVKGGITRVEIPVTPDGPVAPDGGDALQWLGVEGLASGSSSVTSCLLVFGGRANPLPKVTICHALGTDKLTQGHGLALHTGVSTDQKCVICLHFESYL